MPHILILTKFGISFWLALLPMFAASCILSLLVGWICFKFGCASFILPSSRWPSPNSPGWWCSTGTASRTARWAFSSSTSPPFGCRDAASSRSTARSRGIC